MPTIAGHPLIRGATAAAVLIAVATSSPAYAGATLDASSSVAASRSASAPRRVFSRRTAAAAGRASSSISAGRCRSRVFGTPDKVDFTASSPQQRLPALQSGEFDILLSGGKQPRAKKGRFARGKPTQARGIVWAAIRAFCSKVDAGLRRENAIKQRAGAPFRFNRNGKALEGFQPAMRGMFTDRPLGGFRPRKSVAVQSFVFLHGGVEAEDALVLAPHHDADQFVGDFNRVSFRHDSHLASKPAPDILILI